ncbi:unnamed protein product [Blepharisma stoltei]|uniref:Transmembrane protein n=1 Tax=Blepharisma stoltei TaxID=1481888 RepID=A0AAU9K098_9CILI|nr:unnamed protein product [Blepharisma stoltei]
MNLLDWIKQKISWVPESDPNQMLFLKFCKELYTTQELELTKEEKKQFDSLREEERKEYEKRKFWFWPLFVSGTLYLDQVIIMKITKTNSQRLWWACVFCMPLSGIASLGVSFYKESFPSHNYAFELCEKYKISVNEDEKRKFEQTGSF